MTDVLTAAGWKLMVRYHSEKLNKLISISLASYIKYFPDLPTFLMQNTPVDVIYPGPSFTQVQFEKQLFVL